MIISAWWLRTSSKFSGKKSKKTTGLGNGQFLSGCGFVQHIAPPSLSRDRRIKMENKQTSVIECIKKIFIFTVTIVLEQILYTFKKLSMH